MSQDFQSLDLKRWANFDFETATSSEPSPASFPTDYSPPDSAMVEDSDLSASKFDMGSASGDIPPSPPAYQDLEIEVGKVPVYKRPHLKGIFFGTGVLVIFTLLGAALTQGTNLPLGNVNPEAIAPELLPVEDEVDPDQAKLSELEGEVAFSTLKNRAAVLEEQKKQQVLTGQLQEQSQQPEVSASLPPVSSRSSEIRDSGMAIAPSRSYLSFIKVGEI